MGQQSTGRVNALFLSSEVSKDHQRSRSEIGIIAPKAEYLSIIVTNFEVGIAIYIKDKVHTTCA